MLTTTTESDERITTAHRAKLAYVYIRQSSAGQVRQHQESTQLQYRLVGRAASLGWPRDRIEIIDDDLGKSGASSDARYGFQRLIAEIGLGKAGLVLSLDASRLARNNRDWHQLLELCSLFGALIADGERLYDPCVYHDRLLLGLSGIMSEAELRQIKVRLHQGERQKAARGELRMPLPAGLTYRPGGGIILNPDEEVQARLRLVFAEFLERQAPRRSCAFFCEPGCHYPFVRCAGQRRTRSNGGRPATHGSYKSSRTRLMLAPMYMAGDDRTQAAASQGSGMSRPWRLQSRNGLSVFGCLRRLHRLGGFMANQKRLSDNLCHYQAGQRGVARKGSALLQGLAVCGRCGRRIGLRYSGPNANYPVYRCTADHDQLAAPVCQEVRALPVDAEVERLVLEALEPDESRWRSRPWLRSRRKSASWSGNGR